jgi:hypothetical protein
MHTSKFLILLCVCVGPFLAGAAEPPRPAGAAYETQAKHDRDGIGKFYFGREIAKVMGHQAAGWLERRNREELFQGPAIEEGLKDGKITNVLIGEELL